MFSIIPGELQRLEAITRLLKSLLKWIITIGTGMFFMGMAGASETPDRSDSLSPLSLPSCAQPSRVRNERQLTHLASARLTTLRRKPREVAYDQITHELDWFVRRARRMVPANYEFVHRCMGSS